MLHSMKLINLWYGKVADIHDRISIDYMFRTTRLVIFAFRIGSHGSSLYYFLLLLKSSEFENHTDAMS